jgi:hypothetical protein
MMMMMMHIIGIYLERNASVINLKEIIHIIGKNMYRIHVAKEKITENMNFSLRIQCTY